MKYIFALCALLIGCGAAPLDDGITDGNNVVRAGLTVKDADNNVIGYVLGLEGVLGQKLMVLSPEGYMFLLNDSTGFVGGSIVAVRECNGVVTTPWGVNRRASSCDPLPRPVVMRVGGDGEGWTKASSLTVIGANTYTECYSCEYLVEEISMPTAFPLPITLVAE